MVLKNIAQRKVFCYNKRNEPGVIQRKGGFKMPENFNRIKEYRLKKGWSVKQLAAAIGCTEAYIRQIESHKRGMSLATAKQFSVVLGKSLNTLFMP